MRVAIPDGKLPAAGIARQPLCLRSRFGMQHGKHFVFVGGDGGVALGILGPGSMNISVIIPSLVIVVFHLSRGRSTSSTPSSFVETPFEKDLEEDHDG